jgi:hypothetical protein
VLRRSRPCGAEPSPGNRVRLGCVADRPLRGRSVVGLPKLRTRDGELADLVRGRRPARGPRRSRDCAEAPRRRRVGSTRGGWGWR